MLINLGDSIGNTVSIRILPDSVHLARQANRPTTRSSRDDNLLVFQHTIPSCRWGQWLWHGRFQTALYQIYGHVQKHEQVSEMRSKRSVSNRNHQNLFRFLQGS